jgi:hypothetical protein
MHIKPYVVLAAAGVCAGASLAFIAVNIDPATASNAIIALTAVSFVLTVLGLVSAVFSLLGLRLGAAMLVGLVWAGALMGWVWSGHSYGWGWKLPTIAIGATILLSFAIWRLDKRTHKNA